MILKIQPYFMLHFQTVEKIKMFICFNVRQNLGKKSIAFVFCWMGGYYTNVDMLLETLQFCMIWYEWNVASLFLSNLLSSKQWSYHPFWIINIVVDSLKLVMLQAWSQCNLFAWSFPGSPLPNDGQVWCLGSVYPEKGVKISPLISCLHYKIIPTFQKSRHSILLICCDNNLQRYTRHVSLVPSFANYW